MTGVATKVFTEAIMCFVEVLPRENQIALLKDLIEKYYELQKSGACK